MEGGKYLSRSKPTCSLSDPASPHNLCRRSDPPLSVCFTCKGQHLENRRYYYYCATCDLEFHRGCHIFLPEIKHPFHLLHPLTLTSSNAEFDISSITIDWGSSTSDSEDYDFDSLIPKDYGSDENHQKCKCCRRNLGDEQPYYQCSICNVSLHFFCATNSPPLTIKNLRSHDHTLTLFPRRVPLPCDACGFSLDTTFDPVYSCLLCNYMVHRRCIYLPRVIKITRHPHRLSHTSSIFPSVELSCGVCRNTVDVNYGNYSCNKGCHYSIHSKCATKDEVWDGKDLEGVPEEDEEDIEPFVRIDEETIQHFTHDHHHLKIRGNDHRGDHENKFCQACCLPMTVSDSFYSCLQCDFVLHETCASLPRKICLPLHKHPLILLHPLSPMLCDLFTKDYSKGFFRCDGCDQLGSGFKYICSENECHFQLDARCAAISDPLIHDCHPNDHALFFNLTHGECMGCKFSFFSRKFLECIICNSFLCLQCATLPYEAHYKHDKHPLILCYGEEDTTDLQYWCEICETKLDATKWFYTCNSCRVTLHVTCLFGHGVYMKPNHIINIYENNVVIGCNNGNSRPVCGECSRRCKYNLVFRSTNGIFCSISCLLSSNWERSLVYSSPQPQDRLYRDV